MGRFPSWTATEDEILRVAYPTRGTAGVQPLLPGRTQWAIRSRASHLGVPYDCRPWHPAEDAVIRKLYPRGGRNAVTAIIRRDPFDVTQRAHQLGVQKRSYGRWTADEDQALREVYPRAGMAGARVALPWRTEGSIENRRRQLGLRRDKSTEEERAARRLERRKAERERRRPRRREEGKRRRLRNVAVGLCRCGRPPMPRKRRCESCLTLASISAHRRRYGVDPIAPCARCSTQAVTSHGVRLRVAWAIPGSPYCERHRLPPTPEQVRIRYLVRSAAKSGRAVDPVLCACGRHLVNAGTATCWVCAPAPSAPRFDDAEGGRVTQP